MLARAEVHWLSATLRALYAARTTTEFSVAAIQSTTGRFRLSFGSCEEVGRAHYYLHGLTTHVPLPPETPAFLHDHPLMPQVDDMPAFAHVRGRVSQAAFEKTDYFNGVARPMGFDDHIILRVQHAPTTVTFSLCRQGVFGAAETAVLQLLQPHLEAAWQRVLATGRAMARSRICQMRLTPSLQPVGLSETGATCLRRYFPGWQDGHTLPPLMLEWVRDTQRAVAEGFVWRPPRVLLIEAASGTLLVRYFPLPDRAGAELHLMERPGWHRQERAATGLSPREREVLHWIAQGKRDIEIGIILGLSAKTVGKHIEHVLTKLRVTNRTAAVAAAAVN
jgi:DNA-binding CsgD family transcriptional regulator